MKIFKIAFTGHRPNKLFRYDLKQKSYQILFERIKATTENIIKSNPSSNHLLIQGMAQGVDQMAAVAGFHLKKIYPIEIEAAIPFKDHSLNWPPQAQNLYNKIKEHCDYVTYVSDSYDNFCLQRRNMYMVDKCDLLIAVYDNTPGGTKNCINYARSKNKSIIYIDPKDTFYDI